MEIAPAYDNDQKYGAILSIAARQPTSQVRSATTDTDQVLSGFIRYLRERPAFVHFASRKTPLVGRGETPSCRLLAEYSGAR